MQRLFYYMIYGVLWAMSLLPMPILYFKANCLRYILQYVIGYRKQVIEDNLTLVFPEKTEAERTKIKKQYYLHLCDLVVETIKSITISEKELKKRFVVQNLEIVDDYYRNKKSLLIYCSHYANWEWASILSTQIPFKGLGVYKTLRIDFFDTLIRNIRGRFGATIVSNKKIIPALFRSVRKGEQTVTLILADQTPKRSKIKFTDTFMGIEVPIFTGSEEIAKRLDFAVAYLKVMKIKRGYYKATVVPLTQNPKETEDYAITKAFIKEIEKQIEEAPQYYLWSHKRWKHRIVD